MRISTTLIESFRLFMQPDQEWMTEESLIASICGQFVPTPAVRLGLAFGRVLEDPERYRVPLGYVFDDAGFLEYQFSPSTIDPCLALIDRRGVLEAKAAKRYGTVDVVAKADHLLGAHLSEFKTTSSTFDFDKYAASCQWRFYLDIFEAAVVTYHVFILDDHGNGVVTLKSIESFNLYPYPALHQDCVDLLAQFVAYVRAKGLDPLLLDRQRVAEAA